MRTSFSYVICILFYGVKNQVFKSDITIIISMGDLKQQAHWKWVADWGDEKFQGWLDRWEKELDNLFSSKFDGMVTLNIGGGPVPVRFKNAKEEILLDNNADFFKNMYPIKYREGMTILNEDIETTSLKDESIDLVYMRKTLEYIEDWELTLKSIHRIMKKDGYLIIMSHEHQNDGINLNLLDRFKLADYLGKLGFGLCSYLYDDQTTFFQIVGVKQE